MKLRSDATNVIEEEEEVKLESEDPKNRLMNIFSGKLKPEKLTA